MRQNFKGGVYWDEFAETCSDTSRKYGAQDSLHISNFKSQKCFIGFFYNFIIDYTLCRFRIAMIAS